MVGEYPAGQADRAALANIVELLSLEEMMPWTQAQAVKLCRMIEAIAPDYGCHCALTGGTLYKDGPRKDADILFYRIRQTPEIDVDGLMFALMERVGILPGKDHGWCYKATYEDRPIDFFFPERVVYSSERYP